MMNKKAQSEGGGGLVSAKLIIVVLVVLVVISMFVIMYRMGILDKIRDVIPGFNIGGGGGGGGGAANCEENMGIEWRKGEEPLKVSFCWEENSCYVENIIGLSSNPNIPFFNPTKRFYLREGKFVYPNGAKPDNYYSADDYVLYNPDSEKEWIVYNLLIAKIESFLGEDLHDKNSIPKVHSLFKAQPKPLIFRINGDGWDRYILWEEGKWYDNVQYADREFIFIRGVASNWDDGTALGVIYDESDDTSPNPNDEVYWRVGDSGQESPIPGMNGDEGVIDDDDDFEIFKQWFYSKKAELISSAKPDERLVKDFQTAMAKEKIILEGKEISLKVDLQGNYPILKLADDTYGLMYQSLSGRSIAYDPSSVLGLGLFKFSSKSGQWVLATDAEILKLSETDLKDRIKITKIKEFLQANCK